MNTELKDTDWILKNCPDLVKPHNDLVELYDYYEKTEDRKAISILNKYFRKYERKRVGQ